MVLVQHPVDRRGRGQVALFLVEQTHHDLLGRQAGVRRAVAHVEDRLLFGRRQGVSGYRPVNKRALVLAEAAVTGPALVRAGGDAQLTAGRLQAGALSTGLIDQLDSMLAIRGADHDSSSPQIAFAFFRSVSSAAVSARAAFLRASSFSSVLMRLRCCLASSASRRRSVCDRLAACSQS